MPDRIASPGARTAISAGSSARRVTPGASQRFVAAIANLDSGAPMVSVTGEVDLATAPALERTLLDATEDPTGELIVDLTGCSFLDSRGLRALIATRARLERSNRPLALVLTNPNVLRIFQITQCDELFEIYPSLQAAPPAATATATARARTTAMASWREHMASTAPARGSPATTARKELLNARWHEFRGGANLRACPACDADVSGADETVHHGGELYHPDCAPTPRWFPDAAVGAARDPGGSAAVQVVTLRGAAETIPIEHEAAERVVRTIVVAVPPVALGWAGWLAWGGSLHWQDLLVLAITYLLFGLGITVGYHRLFTHRSFKTTRTLRALFAVLGSMAVEGPVVEWVATHRKHHCFSDHADDPHSPHTDDAPGWRGALRGLGHAHLGWIFRGEDMANPRRYASDLLADPDLRFISRTFPLWVVVGLAFPFGLGVALTGSVGGGLTGLLWGGAVRVLLLHHATFSINSLCHFFGARPFATGDESRNLAWLAPVTLGEAWHNNHHAFPTSARHGLGRWQLDPSAWLIAALERCQLAWDVVRIPPERQQAKLAAGHALKTAPR